MADSFKKAYINLCEQARKYQTGSAEHLAK